MIAKRIRIHPEGNILVLCFSLNKFRGNLFSTISILGQSGLLLYRENSEGKQFDHNNYTITVNFTCSFRSNML